MRHLYMAFAFLLVVVFYVSLIAIIAGVGYLVVWALVQGRLRMAFAVGFVGFILVAGLLTKAPPPLGIEKTEDEEPELFALIRDVADRTDTRPPDQVFIAPDTGIGVRETGGILGLPIGSKRVLMIGLGGLQALTMDELRGILAHEMGHFRRGDTAAQRFIARVPMSVGTMLGGIRSGTSWWFVNPIYWYLYLFVHLYMVLVSAMSRQQEFDADRLAAETYGSDVFASGLQKVVVESIFFEHAILDGARGLMAEGKALINAFETHRDMAQEVPTEDREGLLAEVMAEKSGVFASHPTLRERLEAVQAIPPAASADARPASDIFQDRKVTEEEQTEFLTYLLYHEAQAEEE